MEIDFTFWKDGDFFIGYLNEFPDYETQGYSLDELKTNLKSLFEDIKSEEIPYIRQTTRLVLARKEEI